MWCSGGDQEDYLGAEVQCALDGGRLATFKTQAVYDVVQPGLGKNKCHNDTVMRKSGILWFLKVLNLGLVWRFLIPQVVAMLRGAIFNLHGVISQFIFLTFSTAHLLQTMTILPALQCHHLYLKPGIALYKRISFVNMIVITCRVRCPNFIKYLIVKCQYHLFSYHMPWKWTHTSWV